MARKPFADGGFLALSCTRVSGLSRALCVGIYALSGNITRES
jgi:hypothetical protein